ncbi:hypothetical protein LA080_000441 [Diaporthe eres]|nr:hypothetical protein LA080_000441 [Diaporthe eres]
MPAPTYIIGKVADPIFALFIGLSAAATRINREEKDKGRSTSDTISAGLSPIHSGIFRESELIASHEWDHGLIVSDEIAQRLTPVSPSTKTPIIEAYMPTF